VSLRVEEGGRELLRVEVLDVKSNGEAKFRLWYYKWRETRPDKPYVDIEIEPYWYKDGRVGFIGYVYANEAMGISKDHLAEIASLLEREGIKGVLLAARGKQLKFTGAFRDSVLNKLGIRPELPPGEPPDVQHLGDFKFKVGGREVSLLGVTSRAATSSTPSLSSRLEMRLRNLPVHLRPWEWTRGSSATRLG